MNVNISVQDYIEKFCTYPDFPNLGVKFIDIFPLIRQQGLDDFKDFLLSNLSDEIVVLPEARGFIFASFFDPSRILFLRKEYKRPGDVIRIKADKEYGTNTFVFLNEDISQIKNLNGIETPTVKLVFVDDVLATGKTAKGMIEFFNNFVGPNGEKFQVTKVLSYITLKDVFNPSIISEVDDRVEVKSFIEY